MRPSPLLVLAIVAATCNPAGAADSDRGRALYETRCIACHETSVHSRGKKLAANCNEIREQVSRWSRQQGGHWSDEEVEDVTLYLNERYYGFPVREGRCVSAVALR